MGTIILLSQGLTTKGGKKLLSRTLPNDLKEKGILLISLPRYGIDESLVSSCKALGFTEENITLYRAGMNLMDDYHYIYVTEGNSFEILDFMKRNNLLDYIRFSVREKNTDYIGVSAGAMIAGRDIQLAKDFDENRIWMTDFTALGLFDGTIIPHYTRAEFKRYIASTDQKMIKRYKKILSVGDGKVVLVEE